MHVVNRARPYTAGTAHACSLRAAAACVKHKTVILKMSPKWDGDDALNSTSAAHLAVIGRYFIIYFAVIGYLSVFLTCRIGYKGLAQLWQKRSQSARADAETMTKQPSNGCMPNSDWHLLAVRSR
jgi:hypothetical protein